MFNLTHMEYKKICIPEFHTLVFYTEGNEKELKEKINNIMDEYGLMLKKPCPMYLEFRSGQGGKAIPLLRNQKTKPKVGEPTYFKAYVVAIHKGASVFKMKGVNKKKLFMDILSHEIRHVVDSLIDLHHVTDRETPA